MSQFTAEARDGILENATRTKLLVHNPTSFITELLVQQQQFACLQWLCHFGLFERIPLRPLAISYHDLAQKGRVPEPTLRSVVRMIMTMGLLYESPAGLVSHNTLSAAFMEDQHLAVWLSHMVSQTVPVMGGMIQATEKYGDTTKLNETAYNIVMKTDLPFFQHLKSRPDLESEFDSYMKSQAIAHRGVSVEYLLEGYDWNSLNEGGLVVDVGGGSGNASIVLATAHTKLRFVVQDQSIPINNAGHKLAELSVDVSGRIELQEHDFFEPQPVKNADVYLLRMIIHDWPDTEAVKILQQLVQAMNLKSRILIMDMIIPAPGSGSILFEAALRQKDLSMLQAFNARERELSDWQSLIHNADRRLKIRAIRRPESCQHSVIEVALAVEESHVNGN